MKRADFVGLGGLAAMAGGVASATLGSLYVLRAEGVTLGALEKALQKGDYENPVLTMLLLGVLAAIVALHAVQRRSYGSRGALASLAAFIGVAISVGANLLGELVSAMAPVAIPLLLVGLLAASVGIVGLGIVTIGARVLPRWCGLAIIAGSPPFVFLAFMIVGFLEMSLSSLGFPSVVPGGLGWGALWVLPGVPWALVGYALFRAPARLPEQPSRVR